VNPQRLHKFGQELLIFGALARLFLAEPFGDQIVERHRRPC